MRAIKYFGTKQNAHASRKIFASDAMTWARCDDAIWNTRARSRMSALFVKQRYYLAAKRVNNVRRQQVNLPDSLAGQIILHNNEFIADLNFEGNVPVTAATTNNN